MKKLYAIAVIAGTVLAMWLMWLMVNDIGHTINPLWLKVFGYVAFALCCGQCAVAMVHAYRQKELWG